MPPLQQANWHDVIRILVADIHLVKIPHKVFQVYSVGPMKFHSLFDLLQYTSQKCVHVHNILQCKRHIFFVNHTQTCTHVYKAGWFTLHFLIVIESLCKPGKDTSQTVNWVTPASYSTVTISGLFFLSSPHNTMPMVICPAGFPRAHPIPWKQLSW